VFLTSHVLQVNENSPSSAARLTSSTSHAVWRFWPAASGLCRNLVKPTADFQADKMVACGKLVLRPEISRAYWNGMDAGLTIGEYTIVQLAGVKRG